MMVASGYRVPRTPGVYDSFSLEDYRARARGGEPMDYDTMVLSRYRVRVVPTNYRRRAA